MGSPAGLIIASGASAIGGLLLLLLRRKKGSSSLEERSTTSSAGGGAAAYETRKAVDEYLQFHFGADSDILPYPHGPKVSRNEGLYESFKNASYCLFHCLKTCMGTLRFEHPCHIQF